MKQVIFFDLDGTLIDASERHYIVYKDILDFYGIQNTLSKEEFWNQKRKGRKTTELLPETSSEEFIQKFMGEWLKRIEDRNYLKYDILLQESLDVLSILKDKTDLMLVTLRNNKKNLFWELDRLKLSEYFRNVLMRSPLKIEEKSTLIRDYFKNTTKENYSIIIGDSEADIMAGKKLGIPSVAVTYGIRSKEFLEELKPDFCLDNLSELPEILKKDWE